MVGVDLLTLDLHASLLQRIEDAPAVGGDESADLDEDVDSSGPLTLAIDLQDADGALAETQGTDAAPAS